MGRNSIVLLPSLQRRLASLGENLRLARLRRRLTAAQVAERTGISLPTLTAIEQGNPNVSFGAYANVLLCLGLEGDLDGVARDDALGQKLRDAQLTPARRAPRRPRVVKTQPSIKATGARLRNETETPE